MTKAINPNLEQLRRIDKGYDFTAADAAMALTFKRMLEDAEHAARAEALAPRLRELLTELEADDVAEREAYLASLITTASRTLEDATDCFVIGDPATFGQLEFYLSDEPHPLEREKLHFDGHGFFGCHWVPRDVAEEALKRVRSGEFTKYQFWATPGDLLAALRTKGMFTEHRESEVLVGKTSGGKLVKHREGGGLVVESLLKCAASVVDGCLDAHVLRSWLAAALKGDEPYYSVFAEKLRAELKKRGEPEPEPEPEPELELELEPGEEDELDEDDDAEGDEELDELDEDADNEDVADADEDAAEKVGPTAIATAPSDTAELER